MTLVELLVVMGVIGLVAGVLAASISVIFRTEGSVLTRVSESHDVQQAVNYFHLDIESGPVLRSAYATTGTAGSGCSAAGTENVVRFPVSDGFIAYRLTTSGGTGRLDRHFCPTSGSETVVNLADQLDASVTPIVQVDPQIDPSDPTSTQVGQVEMRFAQAITDELFVATPRAEVGLANGPAAADCDDDPLKAALEFGSFIAGDVRLEAGPVEGSVAAAGTLAWTAPVPGSLKFATVDSNNSWGPINVAAYAQRGVNWGLSTGVLSALPGGSNLNVVLGDTDGVPATNDYNVLGVGGGVIHVHQSGSAVPPYIETRGSKFGLDAISSPPGPIDFNLQIAELQDCSDLLGQLPLGANAEFVKPTNPDGTPFSGAGTLNLKYSTAGNQTQVLNITESQLELITSITSSGSSLGNTKPLIVNVVDSNGDGVIVWDFPTSSWSSVGFAKNVLFNFPNATVSVDVKQDLRGTLFAPYATVTTRGIVRGNVVARGWHHMPGAGIVENRQSNMFASTVDFP